MSETKDDVGSLFRAGHLAESVTAAGAAVKRAPADLGARILLAELLLFTGNAERADVVLDAAADIAPDAALVVAEFRQLLRAEVARRQLFRDGRVPEFLGDPPPAAAAALAALVALRAGDMDEAARCATVAEAARPRAPGLLDGATAFDDLRDVDDLCCSHFEVLTTTGKYFWIPVERIESVEFHAPKRPRDLYWRRASMVVRDGPDGDVYVPATYASDDAALTDPLRLGRETAWRQDGAGPVRGVGQRVFLVGDEARGLLEIGSLAFGTPNGAAGA